jgi:ADP-ribosylglycohydrolase
MNPLERMQLSLTGLSVGDALGETFFAAGSEIERRIEQRKVPPAPWRYTDDSDVLPTLTSTR